MREVRKVRPAACSFKNAIRKPCPEPQSMVFPEPILTHRRRRIYEGFRVQLPPEMTSLYCYKSLQLYENATKCNANLDIPKKPKIYEGDVERIELLFYFTGEYYVYVCSYKFCPQCLLYM